MVKAISVLEAMSMQWHSAVLPEASRDNMADNCALLG